jgi:hypothetical protein
VGGAIALVSRGGILAFRTLNGYKSMKSLQHFLGSLGNPKFAPTALRVAAVVGSIVFAINHGPALAKGNMTKTRWASGLLTYVVPYLVSVHGQISNQCRSRSREE